MLEVQDLRVMADGREILHGVDMVIKQGETVVLLGPNGAGKSTIAGALMGQKKYAVSGKVKFLGEDLLKLSVTERARLGLFMTFQNPVEVPGISTTEMLRSEMEEKQGGYVPIDRVREEITEAAEKLEQKIWFSERELNVGFSGGEKKKNEIMQMLVLKPKLVILDEIDSGLDVDAAENISRMLAKYQKESGCAYLVITHNMRVLKHLEPNRALLLHEGHMVVDDDKKLLKRAEKDGFKVILAEVNKG